MQVTINVDTEEDVEQVRKLAVALGYAVIGPDPNRKHPTARVVAKPAAFVHETGGIAAVEPGRALITLEMPTDYADGRPVGSEWDLCSPGFARGVGAQLCEAGIGAGGGSGVSLLAGQRNAYRHALDLIRIQLGMDPIVFRSLDRAETQTALIEMVEAVRVAVEKVARYESDRRRFLVGVLPIGDPA